MIVNTMSFIILIRSTNSAQKWTEEVFTKKVKLIINEATNMFCLQVSLQLKTSNVNNIRHMVKAADFLPRYDCHLVSRNYKQATLYIYHSQSCRRFCRSENSRLLKFWFSRLAYSDKFLQITDMIWNLKHCVII